MPATPDGSVILPYKFIRFTLTYCPKSPGDLESAARGVQNDEFISETEQESFG
jgi:hypothetical protein